MTRRRYALALLALAVALPASGCFSTRGPREVQDAIRERYGVEPEREFGLDLGYFTTKLGLGIAGAASDEPLPIEGLSGIEIVTYRVPTDARPEGKPLSDLRIRGWEPAIRVRDRDGEAVILVRQNASSIRGLLIVAVEGDGEIAVTRLRGRLEKLFQGTLRDAFDGAGSETVARTGGVGGNDD